MREVLVSRLPAFIRRQGERIAASPTKTRFARGASWSLAGTIGARAISVVSSIVVARLLGAEDYGALGIVLGTIALFQVFAGMGLGQTSTKYIAEFRDSDPEKTSRIMTLSAVFGIATGLLCALLMLVLAEPLAKYALGAPHLAALLRISAVMLLMGAVNGVQGGALAGFEAFRETAVISVVCAVLTVPLTIGGVLWLGLEGAIWAAVAVAIVNFTLNHLALRKEMRRRQMARSPVSQCWKEKIVLWRYALPALIAGLMVTPVNWACGAMIVNQPGGYPAFGIYSAANQWFTAIMMLPGVFGQVLLPMLSDQIGQNEWRRSTRIMRSSMALNALIVVPIVAIGSALSPLIMNLYGPQFSEGWPTLIVVLLTAGLMATQSPVGHLIAAAGRMWTGALMNAGWALVFLAATWVWAGWGAVGIASARLLAYAVHALWVYYYAYRLASTGTRQADRIKKPI